MRVQGRVALPDEGVTRAAMYLSMVAVALTATANEIARVYIGRRYERR
jgi:hypothetical protein